MVVIGNKISELPPLVRCDGTENIAVQKGKTTYRLSTSILNGSVSFKIRKVYNSVSAMNSDGTSPVGSDGTPIKPGEIVSIYNSSNPSDPDNNSLYAFQNPGWLQTGKLSQADSKLSDNSTNPVENRVVTQNVIELLKISLNNIKSVDDLNWVSGFYRPNGTTSAKTGYYRAGWIIDRSLGDIVIIDVRTLSQNASVLVSSDDDTILFEENNVSAPIVINLNEYPSAYIIRMSNYNTTYPSPKLFIGESIGKSIGETDARIKAIETYGEALNSEYLIAWKNGKFYKNDLSEGGSVNYQSALIDIDSDVIQITIGVNLIGSGAYTSLVDADGGILWQSNNITDPVTIKLSDYPNFKRLYLSNNLNNNPNPFVSFISKFVDYSNSIKKVSKTVDDVYRTRLYDIIYDETKKIELPVDFLPFPISVNISRNNNNIFGCDINPLFLRKNNLGGKTYYLSPNGSDDNSGLSPSVPLKTLESALSHYDVNTIILLDGEYVSGINFQPGIEINKELNIEGDGDVSIDSLSGEPIRITNGCYVENIAFNRGNVALNCQLKEGLCVFVECSFNNSVTSNGFQAEGGSYIMYKCVADNNMRDGFGYKGLDNEGGERIYPFVVEINCSGRYNGIDDVNDINNCSTMHEYGKIIRINCCYRSSKGAVVADADNAKSVNFGVISGNTLTTLENRNCNFAGINKAKMWLYDCASFGSEYDVISDNSNVYVTSNFPKQSQPNGGTISLIK